MASLSSKKQHYRCILLFRIAAVVTSFQLQAHIAILRNTRSQICAATAVDGEGCPAATAVAFDEAVVVENTQIHLNAVKKSEQMFYGYYNPDGFTEFDWNMCPSSWVEYSSNEMEINTDLGAEYSVIDTLLQIDKRIVPSPFKPTELALASQTPILTSEECLNIINECESHYYGWGSSNDRYGTPSNRVGHMLSLENLSYTYTLVNFSLLPRLYPAISRAFARQHINPENLRLAGCRIVKYDAEDGHVELGMHRDGLLFTANIALNDVHEYKGGGTKIEGLEDPIRLPKGHVLIHPGDVRHGGEAITHGIRYVLVCFVLDATFVPHEKLCQDRMRSDLDAAMAIPPDDVTRLEERSSLLVRATKHCHDAYLFGKLVREQSLVRHER